MSKKENNKFLTISRYIKYVILALLFGAILSPLSPAITWTVKTATGSMSTHYGSAFDFMFSNVIHGNIDYKTLSNTILPLIAWVLVLISFVLILLSVLKVNHKLTALTSPLALILLIVATILAFSRHKEAATVLADALINRHDENVVETIYKNTSLNFGIIGIAIFSLLSSIGLFINLFLNGTIDRIRNIISK